MIIELKGNTYSIRRIPCDPVGRDH